MFWERWPYLTNIASDCLRAELSCGREEMKIKMDDSVARFSTCFGGNFFLFVDLLEVQPCLGDPE